MFRTIEQDAFLASQKAWAQVFLWCNGTDLRCGEKEGKRLVIELQTKNEKKTFLCFDKVQEMSVKGLTKFNIIDS